MFVLLIKKKPQAFSMDLWYQTTVLYTRCKFKDFIVVYGTIDLNVNNEIELFKNLNITIEFPDLAPWLEILFSQDKQYMPFQHDNDCVIYKSLSTLHSWQISYNHAVKCSGVNGLDFAPILVI